MVPSSARARTNRSPPRYRPSEKALVLAALSSELRMLETIFNSSSFRSKLDDVAQTLSPAMLAMAALSRWPLPTRLFHPVSISSLYHSGYIGRVHKLLPRVDVA